MVVYLDLEAEIYVAYQWHDDGTPRSRRLKYLRIGLLKIQGVVER